MNRHDNKRDPFSPYYELAESGWYASSSGISYSAYTSTRHGSLPTVSDQTRVYHPSDVLSLDHVAKHPNQHAISLHFERPQRPAHVPNRLTISNRPVESMEQHKYGRFAEAAYHWRDEEKSTYYQKSFAHVREASGFKIDTKLSSLRTSVFHNATTGETVFASRGTDPLDKTGQDQLTDYAILNLAYNEKNSARFKSEDARLKATIAKYGRNDLILTGHSLGGSLVIQLSRDNDVEAYAYNPGISLASAMDKSHQSNSSKIHIFVTENDPVSIGRHVYEDTKNTSITYVSQKNKIDPHGPDNFLSDENQNTDGTFDDVHGATYETFTDTVEKLSSDRYKLFDVIPTEQVADVVSFVSSMFTSSHKDDDDDAILYPRVYDDSFKGDTVRSTQNVAGPSS
jgi:hypothetical protein